MADQPEIKQPVSDEQEIKQESEQPPPKKKNKGLSFAGALLTKGFQQPNIESSPTKGFFLEGKIQSDDRENDRQFEKSNINTGKSNAEGFFLGKIIEQVLQQEENEELEKLNKIKNSTDPYEAFSLDNPNYPVKEDEMGFFDKFFSESLQGMPSVPTARCTLFCNLICWFYFLIFGVVFIAIANNIIEVEYLNIILIYIRSKFLMAKLVLVKRYAFKQLILKQKCNPQYTFIMNYRNFIKVIQSTIQSLYYDIVLFHLLCQNKCKGRTLQKKNIINSVKA